MPRETTLIQGVKSMMMSVPSIPIRNFHTFFCFFSRKIFANTYLFHYSIVINRKEKKTIYVKKICINTPLKYL